MSAGLDTPDVDFRCSLSLCCSVAGKCRDVDPSQSDVGDITSSDSLRLIADFRQKFDVLESRLLQPLCRLFVALVLSVVEDEVDSLTERRAAWCRRCSAEHVESTDDVLA